MSGIKYPSMEIARILIPVTFAISCIATIVSVIFAILLKVYYNKIRDFNCKKYLEEEEQLEKEETSEQNEEKEENNETDE